MSVSPTHRRRFATRLLAAAAAIGIAARDAEAAPPIRSSEDNPVPRCVTPARLMSFIEDRNTHLDPRFHNIALYYMRYGEGWRVRWDYAFFQMVLETNYLTFRRGDGSRGDVRESQNNFAGIGATGGGAHGERFADVATGVHAQIQHLVAYSGERLAQPIAARTRERQGDIVEASLHLGRPVTFGDLARRWAVDRAYGKSIDFVANLYRTRYCPEGTSRSAEDIVPPAPQPARRDRTFPWPPPSGLGGPKDPPAKLAGPQAEPEASAPEVLPWLVKPTTRKAAAKEVSPSKSSATVPPKHRSQIKTIWSRGDDARKFDPGQPPPLSGDSWADVTVVRQRSAQSGIATSDAPSGGTPNAPVDTDNTPTLPTFRIAPLAAAPSRLGGPLPTDLPPAAPQAPITVVAPEIGDMHCHVVSASYGGTKTLLVRSIANGERRYTALTVLDGFERSMFETYARSQAAGAQIVGEYPDRDEALADARMNCPDS